ncbi:hypothetical protein [Halopseudomonas laoshanensis]|jgi:hypothetical protein|uniref:hypothetical protein n=1 Tax=Halopseudomonas laoshanensis TaxID=2268758 RepID=UPI003736F402
MQSATVHILPSCDINSIFLIRQAARDTGAKLVVQKPKLVARTRAPFDPNDGGRAA